MRTDKALDAVEQTDMPVLRIEEISAEDALRMRKSLSDELDDTDAGMVAAPAGELPTKPVEEIERVSEGEDAYLRE